MSPNQEEDNSGAGKICQRRPSTFRQTPRWNASMDPLRSTSSSRFPTGGFPRVHGGVVESCISTVEKHVFFIRLKRANWNLPVDYPRLHLHTAVILVSAGSIMSLHVEAVVTPLSQHQCVGHHILTIDDRQRIVMCVSLVYF